MDKVILGEGCFAEESIGTFSPNNNQLIVGCSGTGKSMSVLLPTILNTDESSIIGTYSKRGEARKIAAYLESKGYRVLICDLVEPETSTVSFDPLDYVRSYLDVEDLSKTVLATDPGVKKMIDPYWTDGGALLLTSLMLAVLMTKENATMSDVLDLFDLLKTKEVGKGMRTTLDELFAHISREVGSCQAVDSFADFQMLPYSTAGCIRDTLAKSVRKMFPGPIRKMMRIGRKIDFEKLATEKTALLIITSPVNTAAYAFANLMFSVAIKQLLEFAEKCEGHRLPRPVRLLFDDFACAAKINDFSKHIAIFRAAGVSAMMLLQSESQLISLYSEEEAVNIINNCSAYVYFPGGMDLKTCKNISERMDLPLMDIMYAPVGHVIVMQSGKEPVIVPRYDTFSSPEYSKFLAVNEDREKAETGRGGLQPVMKKRSRKNCDQVVEPLDKTG